MRRRRGSPIGQVVAAGVLLLGSWAGGRSPRALFPGLSVLGLNLQPQSSGPPFDLPPLLINKSPGFTKPPAFSLQAWGGAARRPLDVDEGSLVAIGRFGLHAAPFPPRDPAVPVEFGVATQP